MGQTVLSLDGGSAERSVGLAPIPLAYYIDAYVLAKRITGQLIPPDARRAQRNLHLFCRLAPVDPRQVRPEHVARFLERHEIIASHHTELTILRGLFDYLVFRGVVSSNPTIGAQLPKRAPQPLSEASATILDAIDRDVLDPRSSLVLSMMFCDGLGRSEIARMRLEDIDVFAAIIRIRNKNRFELVRRVVPISDRTIRAFATYTTTLNRRRGPLIGNLLSPERGVSVGHIGTIAHKALSSLGIKRLDGAGAAP